MIKQIIGKIWEYKWWSGAVLLVLIITAYFTFNGGGGTSLQLASVERRNVTQVISETGSITPTKSVDLAFRLGGRIAFVSANVGNHIYSGAALVGLDASDIKAQLAKSQANLSGQTARIAQDQTSLNNTYTDIVTTLNSAFTSANDTVRVKIDPLYINGESNPQLVFYSNLSNNAQGQNDSTTQRTQASAILNSWASQISATSNNTPTSTLEQSLATAVSNLNGIETLLNTLNNILLNVPNISQSTILTYKGYVSSARSEVDSALSSVSALSQNIASEKAAIVSDTATQNGFAADVDNLKAQLSQTVIYSPIAGVITVQNAKVGEIAAPNAVLTSVISDQSLEIDTNIPEVDIAKVAVGDQTKVTLDAYGSDVVFDANVISIDPGQTMIEGVATYLTKLQFSKRDSRIKSGMTANIDIVSATHENVLAVPQRAVRKYQNQELVSRYLGNSAATSTEDVIVTTGLRGSDGYVEILSGLNEHDQVVIPHS